MSRSLTFAVVVAAMPLTLTGIRASESIGGRGALSARPSGPPSDTVFFDIDRARLESELENGGTAIRDAFPIGDGRIAVLELERFRIAATDARFVVGRVDGADVPLDFDPSAMLFLRGKVMGRPQSHVFLALSDGGGHGSIDLGPGESKYRVSSRTADRAGEMPGRLIVTRAESGGGMPPGVPLCGVDDSDVSATVPADWPDSGGIEAGAEIRKGLKVVELAVETDYELFLLNGSLEQTAAYVTGMYAEVSAIYMRDVNTQLKLTFVRLWDDRKDLFNQENPLGYFRNYWNQNMRHVRRDVAQFLSGRRNMPYGGAAWLGGLCNDRSYSVVGYVLGFFPNPQTSSVWHYDIFVTAHELGHSFNAHHTHSYGIDDCFNLDTPAQRGTIMSYCSQTVSGGNSVSDLRIHGDVQRFMEKYVAAVGCLDADCNLNGVDDAEDIAEGASDDVNENGVPDECEDCNNNGILDDEDIRSGRSEDINENGIPDECEPDCNQNGKPDDYDIATGFSEDVHRNNIPDECEQDCDGNGEADYNQIMADMPLDVNRDVILDSCQDCDQDGTIDLVELHDAHSIWIASQGEDAAARAFHGETGVLTRVSTPNRVTLANDLIVTPDERVLITSGGDHRVAEFDRMGAYVGDFVTAGSGGLSEPTGLVIGPNGNVFVSSRGTNSVLEYDGKDGAFVGVFVQAGAGGLDTPFGLAFGPNGNLFVAGGDGQVREYDGESGAFVRLFVTFARSGGLTAPRGMAFKPDGNLLVASFGTNSVLEYDGRSGTFVRQFNDAGTRTVLTMDRAWGVRVAPDGNVHISRHRLRDDGGGGGGPYEDDDGSAIGDPLQLHVNSTRVYIFDVRTGIFLRSFVTGNDTELRFSTGFDYMPGWETDCNQNRLPDRCDILLGYSKDENENGVPDECEVDCNENGVFDRLDIIPYGDSFDCNGNGEPDECDIKNGVSRDCNNNGIPDECEVYTVVYDNFERDLGWEAVNLGASDGDWQRGVPINDPNWPYDPRKDSDRSGRAYLTANRAGDSDVDEGAVRLISPTIDMSAGEIAISYDYFLRISNAQGRVDALLVEINNNDGAGEWIELARHDRDGGLEWRFHEITQEKLDVAGVELTDRMKVRFTVNDADPQSVVEAALDAFRVTAAQCVVRYRRGDTNCDGSIDLPDVEPFILALLDKSEYKAKYPACNIDTADVNRDGSVDLNDVDPFIELLLRP